MIIESAVACVGGALTYMYLSGKDKRKIRNDWRETLLNCKAEGVKLKKTINNKTFYKTYMLNKMYPTKYGWLAMANIPTGLTVSALESAKEALEDKFGCKIEMEKEIDGKRRTFVKVKFIFNDVWTRNFEPVNTTGDELFAGYQLDGTPYKINLHDDPQIIIAGKTGSGKDYLLATMLGNAFYKNPKDFEVYLIQGIKGEIKRFADCKPVKFCATNNDEINTALNIVRNIINSRSKKIDERNIYDIEQWNETYPNEKMKRILLVTNEMAYFIREQKKPDNDKENELVADGVFVDIVQTGRSVGVHFIGLVQRTTVQNLSSEVKAQTMVITSRQRSGRDAMNAVESIDAKDLKIREFMSFGNNGYATFKTPTLDKAFLALQKYVPEIRVPKKDNKNNPEEVKPTTTISTQPTKYTSETSQQIPMTPEEYYHKTGYMPYELRKKMGIIEIKIDEKIKEVTIDDVKPQQKPSNNKGQVNGKVTSSRGGYPSKQR